jgi:hypothetical protein
VNNFSTTRLLTAYTGTNDANAETYFTISSTQLTGENAYFSTLSTIYIENQQMLNSSISSVYIRAGTVLGTTVTSLSDARMKQDIENILNAISVIKQMNPVYYNWIDHTSMNPGHKEVGFIAQQLEQVLPNVVSGDESTGKTVAYGNITAMIIAAIKEQQTMFEDIYARLSTIEGRLA